MRAILSPLFRQLLSPHSAENTGPPYEAQAAPKPPTHWSESGRVPGHDGHHPHDQPEQRQRCDPVPHPEEPRGSHLPGSWHSAPRGRTHFQIGWQGAFQRTSLGVPAPPPHGTVIAMRAGAVVTTDSGHVAHIRKLLQ